jgi:hypothetical protein
MLSIVMAKRLILNSWKEIADYMGRGVRTVQRYERDLRLPVHRPAGKGRSAVLAFADEIDHWMREGPLLSANGASPNGAPVKIVHANLPEWQRLRANSELLLKRTDALKANLDELVRLMKEANRRRKFMQDKAVPLRLSRILNGQTKTLHVRVVGLSELIARGR